MPAQTARKLNNYGFQTMHLHRVQNAPVCVHRLKTTDLNRLHCIKIGRATDGACGTGGMLTVAQNRLLELAKKHGKEVAIHLFGQEINPETYAKVRRHFIWQRKKMR